MVACLGGPRAIDRGRAALSGLVQLLGERERAPGRWWCWAALVAIAVLLAATGAPFAALGLLVEDDLSGGSCSGPSTVAAAGSDNPGGQPGP